MEAFASTAAQEQKAAQGDRSALTALIQHYDPILHTKLRGEMPKRWQSLLSVEDVLQETCTDVFLGIEEFVPNGKGAFERWIGIVARHNLLNAIQGLEADKRGGNRPRVGEADPDESFAAFYELLAGTTTPSRNVAGGEARAALEKAIERLPSDYQLVVRMYDIEEHPVDHLAKTMSRSPGAVFMLRARAHRSLRKLMGTPLDYSSNCA